MDWLIATPHLQNIFSNLGSIQGDTYVINPNALAILKDINYKLTYEDQTLRTFRRAIGFGQNVRSDLMPLLENAKDEEILDAVIRILVNLTVPVECLFSVDIMYRTEVGRHTIYELNNLLHTSKEVFTDPKSTKSVVEYMKHILESESKLTPRKCDQINNCLLLLRNILHIPEIGESNLISMQHSQHSQPVNNSHSSASMQNTILWNLFIQSIDKLLLHLMTCPQRSFWGVTIVQLIALIYKDQHASTLQKLLNLWFEASISESSEDNESNTSPPKQSSFDSSPMLTSDPTSDSSDNGKSSPVPMNWSRRLSAQLAILIEASNATGGAGCKNVSSEDRRQALREETEATLQEVSRKGREYQDSLRCVVADKIDSDAGATDFEETSTLTAENVTVTPLELALNFTGNSMDYEEVMDSICEEEGGQSDVTVIETTPKPKSFSSWKQSNECNELYSKLKQEHEESLDHLSLSSLKLCTLLEEEKSDNLMTASDSMLTKSSNDSTRINSVEENQVISTNQTVQEVDNNQKTSQKAPHSGRLILSKGKCCPQKRECPSSQSELSDCGYGTQVENQESISTSSNDSDGPQSKPQHQKPPCNSKPRNKQRNVITPIDKKELRRKKLVKRSKSSLINMKGLVQHTPTDEDISNLLKEFTVDFLLKGYGHLVEELHTQLLSNLKIPIDTSHFFWLVTYFLKFATQLELDMEHINSILTFDVISYLTYEGVMLCEHLELNSCQEGSDLKPYLRRMHLVVTAIREFLQAIETYKKVTHLTKEDREYLCKLQFQIGGTEDLRNLFVLLLRRFNPTLHTKQYLQDLVVTNHILLLILDSVNKSTNSVNIKMFEHISQFASLEIMHYYGVLLEDFSNNGEYVNDCIFTMMHHIGGDLGQIGTLFQPVILKTYSRIWEADYQLCDDWSDLIEYVIHKFMNTPQKNSLTLPNSSLTELTKEYNLDTTVCSWTREEIDTLYWYYVQSKKSADVVGKIVKLFNNNGNKENKDKSRISIIQQLLQQDIITLVEYNDLMKFEDAAYQRTLLTTPTSATTESGLDVYDSPALEKPSDDIQILRDLIVKEKKEQHLIWLQKILLECCYIKLILKKHILQEDRQNLKYVMEPVAYHCILKNKSIPVVQWNNEQATTMQYQPFVLLLHKLGFQLPADAGSIYARIPDFWTPEMMYILAKKLGPLDKLLIKIDADHLNDISKSESNTGSSQQLKALNSIKSSSTKLASGKKDYNIEIEVNQMEDLAIITELDMTLEKPNCGEIFAMPKAKHCNAIIRFTPDPTIIFSAPQWLQLVMRNKYNYNSIITDHSGCNKKKEIQSNLGHNIGQNSPSSSSVIDVNLLEVEPSLLKESSQTRLKDDIKDDTNVSNCLTTTLLTNTATTTTISQITPDVSQTYNKCNNKNFCHQTIASNVSTTSITSSSISDNKFVCQANTMLSCSSSNSNKGFNSSNIMPTTLLTNFSISTPTTSSKVATLLNRLEQQPNQQQPDQHYEQNNLIYNLPQQRQHFLLQQQLYQKSLIKPSELLFEPTISTPERCLLASITENSENVIDTYLDLEYPLSNNNGNSLEQEYSAMLTSLYKQEIDLSDSASVASDLTHMHISDEDEYRVATHCN